MVPPELVAPVAAAAKNPDCRDANDTRRRARGDRASFAGAVPRAAHLAPRRRSTRRCSPRR
jgi:hypothetical protein